MVPPTVPNVVPACARERRATPARREAGFGVIEVIIAALLLSAVIGAMAFASTGGQRLRGATRLQTSMTQAGKSLQENLSQNRAWMKTCDTTCDLTSKIDPEWLALQDVGDGGSFSVVKATAEPIDSAVDLTGAQDRDGVVPDYYRLSLIIEPSTDVASRFGTLPQDARRVVVSSIDSRGLEQIGSVVVQGCSVLNQFDERMVIQGCRDQPNGSLTSIRMDGCPPPSPASYAGCVSAFDWVKNKSASASAPSPFVTMHRVPLGSFQLVAADGTQYPSSGAKVVDGDLVFQNIPAGLYHLNGLPAHAGNGTVRWVSKEIPAYHGVGTNPSGFSSLSVEPGIQSRALVLFRPDSTHKGIRFKFERRTHTFHVNAVHHSTEQTFHHEATHSYQGAFAAAVCDRINSLQANIGFHPECEDRPKPAPNCAKVRVRYTGELVPAAEQAWHSYKFCTWYDQVLTHTYYTSDGVTAQEHVPGAVESGLFYMRAAADNRAAIRISDGVYDTIPEQCKVIGHETGAPDHPLCADGLKIDDLDAGLNSGVQTIGAMNKNMNLSATPPSWLWSDAIWVKMNGALKTSSGASVSSNPLITMRGEGECYWKWAGNPKREASDCGPCNIVWKTGKRYPGKCSLLVKTCLSRTVYEEGTYPGFEHDDITDTTWGGQCYPNYDPPWGCTTVIPSIGGGGTCHKESPPPPYSSHDFHSHNSGGNGDILNGDVTSKGNGV